ncbi:MAG: hypothetical protein O6922_08785, partial [Chloroflexi bacterium]|nr:hypothetical protein [Chloroflexota bacterium]
SRPPAEHGSPIAERRLDEANSTGGLDETKTRLDEVNPPKTRLDDASQKKTGCRRLKSASV